MFKYIIIIIYEVPTPGRAEKKKWCRKQKVVPKIKMMPKTKSRAENKNDAENKKSCQKKNRAEKKKSCRKKRVVPKKTVVPQKNSRARENWRREKETWWEKLGGTNWLSPGYALITPYKPFEIFWGSTPPKFTDRIRTNYVPGSQIVGKTKNRTWWGLRLEYLL